MNPRFSRTVGLLAMVVAMLATLAPSAAVAAPPAQEVTCAEEYIVQAGDSLGKIADKYLGDSAAYPAIVEATSQKNAVDATFAEITDPNVIQIGWKICVPQAGEITVAQAVELVVEAGTYEIQGKPYVADIGTLTVPENRSNPDSRLMELPVVRIHATGDNPVEPVFLLAGGPGGPNMWGDGVPVWLLDHHDVVMVGYRGVDGSVYLDAPEVVEVIREVEQDPLSSENLERMGNAQYAANQRLRVEGVDIDVYNMVEVIDDMEAAREGLGYGKINLFSGSYGTRLAYIYGLRYPESLFRSLLFAVNPPGRMVWEPDRIDAQLRYYGDLWKKDPEAVAKSPDIVQTMQNVLETLPQEWNGIRVDPDRVKMMTFLQLMNTGTAAAVFDAFVAAENGDYSGLAFMSFAYSQMLPTMLHWGDLFSKGMADHDPLRDYEADMDPPGSIIGSPGSKLYFGGAPHGGWPMQPIAEEYRQLGYSDVETLLVSGSVDFSTPAENAQELLPYLPNGKSVVLSEMGHTGDQRGLQPEAFQHLAETFYLEGVVDDSKFTYQPMNFTPSQTFQDMAKAYMEQSTTTE